MSWPRARWSFLSRSLTVLSASPGRSVPVAISEKYRCLPVIHGFFGVRALTHAHLLVFDRQAFETKLLADPMIHGIFEKSQTERQILANLIMHGATAIPSALAAPGGVAASSLLGPASYPIRKRQAIPAFSRKLQEQLTRLAGGQAPMLIIGESGTGRRLVAQQIHLLGDEPRAPYMELDLRDLDAGLWEGKLFGVQGETFPFSTGRQLGIFEQMPGGTVVLLHAELLAHGFQEKLVHALCTKSFTPVIGEDPQPLRARLLFITSCPLADLRRDGLFLPAFLEIIEAQTLPIPPIREHKRDIPALAQFYLHHYAAEYNRKVERLAPGALGLLMKYDWPGNLTELAGTIQRAVMISQEEEILSEQILLGLPRTEGKMSYNLLRFPQVRAFFTSRLFPTAPRLVVSALFVGGILVLLFGPQAAEHNLGITLSWHLGWPLLMISFFFLPRLWCSVCALSAPGVLLQKIFKPRRRLPLWLTTRSGWIMAVLCLIVFWVEIVWDAYHDTRLTAGILLTISLGALVFSLLFQRNSWCRYLCPLGAMNAVFSMPSVLELRANRHLCDNQCAEHTCYLGSPHTPGCPMFRQPFMVDNNKDCILCGRCIKNCRLQSIQLNLRITPHELWMIQTPRLADSFLVVALAAIFFPLARHQQFLQSMASWELPPVLAGSLLFWGLIFLAYAAYALLAYLAAWAGRGSFTANLAALGYGLLPLVLGGFLAVHVRLLLNESWRLLPNFFLLFGIETHLAHVSPLSQQGIVTLVNIIILGGLCASLFATRRIMVRQLAGARLAFGHIALVLGSVLLLGVLYLKTI